MIQVQVPALLRPYQTDHLILLVGENPLPNLVAALLLGKKEGQISLLYSSDTVEISRDLGFQLVRQGFNVNYWQVKETDPTSIASTTQQALRETGAQSVGLHYTGGTKAMSVYAYRVLERWTAAAGRTAVFSYLDARELQMVISPNDPESGEKSVRVPVGKAVCLAIRDLMDLHGWTEDGSQRELRLPRTTAALAKLHQDKPGGDAWRDWKSKELRENTYFPKSNTIMPDARLRGVSLQLPGDAWAGGSPLLKAGLEAVRQGFAADTGLDPERFEVLEAARLAAIGAPAKQTRDFLSYLDGAWLEMHVLAVLREIADRENVSLDDSVRNLTTQTVNFELDVVAMRGYQMFIFSCTSATWEAEKGVLKKRLFEASVRARQVGGDEARVALVCLHENPFGVEQEMAEMIGGFSQQRRAIPNRLVKVFGRPQLANLAEEIATWVIESSGKGS